MIFLKSIFLHFIFTVLGFLAAAFLSFTALSYFTVDQLSKAFHEDPTNTEAPSIWDQPLNPNVKEIILIGTTYIKELDLFDQLQSEISQSSSPEMCSVLCNPVGMNPEALATEKVQLLARYYQQNKTAALKDPLFRLRMQEAGFLSQLFPASFRSVLKEIQEKPMEWTFVLKLQWTIFKEMITFVYRWESMKSQLKDMENHRSLFQSCRKGAVPKKNLQDCQSQSL